MLEPGLLADNVFLIIGLSAFLLCLVSLFSLFALLDLSLFLQFSLFLLSFLPLLLFEQC